MYGLIQISFIDVWNFIILPDYVLILGIQLNQSCQFDEQCEYFVWNSMCKNFKCICRGDGRPVELEDGSIKCKGILGYVFINLLSYVFLDLYFEAKNVVIEPFLIALDMRSWASHMQRNLFT